MVFSVRGIFGAFMRLPGVMSEENTPQAVYEALLVHAGIFASAPDHVQRRVTRRVRRKHNEYNGGTPAEFMSKVNQTVIEFMDNA